MLTELIQNESKKINRKPKLMNIDIDDISTNKYNKRKIEGISDLADSIKNYGLLKPLEVYELDDGTYRIIGGERRYTALKNLIDNGEYDPEIPCLVYKVEQGVRERMQIALSNAQWYTEEDKVLVTGELLELLELDPTVKPNNMLTRDWIASFIGCKGRTVQKYINKLSGNSASKTTTPTKDYSYPIELLRNKFRTKVKIDQKKITIYYSGDDDLNRIIEKMDALEKMQQS